MRETGSRRSFVRFIRNVTKRLKFLELVIDRGACLALPLRLLLCNVLLFFLPAAEKRIVLVACNTG